MGNDKIINLPIRRDGQVPAVELPLFGDPATSHGLVAFIDVQNLNQDTLFNIITRNSVSAVIDVRKAPIFSRPRFRHAEVADYFWSRRIAYLDLTSQSVQSSFAEAHISLLASQPHHIIGKVAEILDRGLTLVIYEESAFNSSATADLRRLFVHHGSYRAEIHPKALNR
jgi:hypothetical protein